MYTVVKIIVGAFGSIFNQDALAFTPQNGEDHHDLGSRMKLETEFMKVEISPTEDDCTPVIIIITWIAFVASYVFIHFRKVEGNELPKRSTINKSLREPAISMDEHPLMDELELPNPKRYQLSVKINHTDSTQDSCASKIDSASSKSNDETMEENLFDLINNQIEIIPSAKSNCSLNNSVYQPVIDEIKEMETSCQCNLDELEERLEAVEDNLKSTETVTRQWGKTINQTEQELVDLHRQMYTILSKARFTPSSEENVENDEELCNFKDITDSTIDNSAEYPIPITETKKQPEEELFQETWNGVGDCQATTPLLREVEEVELIEATCWTSDLNSEVSNHNISQVLKEMDISMTPRLSEVLNIPMPDSDDFIHTLSKVNFLPNAPQKPDQEELKDNSVINLSEKSVCELIETYLRNVQELEAKLSSEEMEELFTHSESDLMELDYGDIESPGKHETSAVM